jgi:acyl-coenzyme A thioesterase PaaI-like protein
MAEHIGQEFIGINDQYKVQMSIPFNEKFIGNVQNQSMHLGPITAVLDSAAGLSVMQANGSFAPFVTLDLRIDQLNPAIAGSDITVECHPYLRKGDLFYVRGIAWQKDKDQPVLLFTSVFMAAHQTFNLDGSKSEASTIKVNMPVKAEPITAVEFTSVTHPVHQVVPYSKDLNMEVGKNSQGERLIKLPFEYRHMGNPITKALQGGIFLGFLECAGSAYLLDLYPDLKQSVSASFFMEYLKAPKPQDTFAKVSASKIGRRVVNIDLEAFQEGRGVVAKASGRYLVLTS